MFEERDAKAPQQGEFRVVRDHLPMAAAGTFYRKLDETLRAIGFAEAVREVCRPAYRASSAGGRPGIDPAVYFKMLMIGFFENLPSERAIASRCEDSLSLRAFLGYDLTEATPDHSSLSVIRTCLGVDVYQAALEVVLRGLREHKLLKGRHLGIDSSIIEANASLRELQHRNTEEHYWSYVKKLAAEAGIDPDDTKGVRRFDKKREGRKTSNEDWVNPHDTQAKVGYRGQVSGNEFRILREPSMRLQSSMPRQVRIEDEGALFQPAFLIPLLLRLAPGRALRERFLSASRDVGV